MATKIEKLESELTHVTSSADHFNRLINALDNPSEWKYTGNVFEAQDAYCACGHPIRYCFQINHPDGRNAIIGSTCINHFQSVNPELAASLNAAKDALVERVRTSEAQARRVTKDAENATLWNEYSALRDEAISIHSENRYRNRHSPRSLWLFVEGWNETMNVSSPPQYQRAGDLKRWIKKAIMRVQEALEAENEPRKMVYTADRQEEPTINLGPHNEGVEQSSAVDLEDGFEINNIMQESPIPFLGTHNMTVTVTSPKSGEHRTFMVKTVRGEGALIGKRIIALLSGPNNEEDYIGFGFVQEDGTIKLWRKHQGTQYEKYADLFDRPAYWETRGMKFLAEGRCRRCNRRLTVPQSITDGIGPECITKE